MKIKTSARFSSVLPPLIFFAFFTALFGLVWGIVARQFFPFILAIAGFVSFAGFLRFFLNSEAEWRFDKDERTAKFIGRSFGSESIIYSHGFSRITAILVQGRQNRDRIRTWWNYRLQMLLQDGQLVSLSEFFDGNPEKANRLAHQLAGLVECQCVEAREEKVTRYRLIQAKPEVWYSDWGWSDVFREFGWATLSVLAFLAGLILFIYAAVVILSQSG